MSLTSQSPRPVVCGATRVLCADARLRSSYSCLLGNDVAHLLLADPPYCLLTRRRKGGDLRDPKNRKIDRQPITRFESVRDYRRFTSEWLPAAVAHLAPETVAVIWTNYLGKEPIVAMAKELGYAHMLGEFVWAKRSCEKVSSEQLLRVYETALVFSPVAPKPLSLGEANVPWAVVSGYDDDGEAAQWGSHPNHKPFGVLEPLIRSFSRKGTLILDPFGGSGSVAAAAVRLGRRAATMEINADWAETIATRLSSVAHSDEIAL